MAELIPRKEHFVTVARKGMSLITCQRDSYLRSINASVVCCEENDGTSQLGKVDGRNVTIPNKGTYFVQLHDTILFPEGGGQPSDSGTIDGIPVLDVFRNNAGVVVHLLSNKPAHEEVEVQVDWTRRFDHMQQHTAQHLISALATQHFNANTVSWQLGRDYCTIDFNVSDFSAPQLTELEDLANQQIREAKPVNYKVIKSEEEKASLPEAVRSRGLPEHLEAIRLVEIEGIDLNTCCGTHVRCLSQIQMVKFIGKEKKKGLTRVTFLAGNRLCNEASKWVEREKKLNTILQTNPDDHVAAATRIAADAKNLANQNKSLFKELAVFIGKDLVTRNQQQEQSSTHTQAKEKEKEDEQQNGSKRVVVEYHREDGDMGLLQGIGKVVQEAQPEWLCFMTCGSDTIGSGQFLLLGPKEAVTTVGKQVAELLGGKGGGKPGAYQGKAASFKRRKEVLELLKGSARS